jgi:hypothetical protein
MKLGMLSKFAMRFSATVKKLLAAFSRFGEFKKYIERLLLIYLFNRIIGFGIIRILSSNL